MVIDISSYNEVLKITVSNFIKLVIISYFVFIILPKYIFPQKHIRDDIDRIVFNFIYMIGAILLIIPLLVFLKIFSYITLILSFFLLKVLLVYIFEKKNYFVVLKNSFPPLFIKILNKLDHFYNNFVFGKYGSYKKLFSPDKISYLKIFRGILLFSFIAYVIYDINLMNFLSLSNKAPDVSQFIEWVANLQKGRLYYSHKTGGADFYGQATFVFFLQLITNIDSVVLFSVYPSILLLMLLLSIFYVVYKCTGSIYSGFFAIIIYTLYILSPLAKYLTGYLYATANPHIANILGAKIYFTCYEDVTKKFAEKNFYDFSYYAFARINAGLAYEFSSSFFLYNLYFLTMSFWKKKLKYLILYSLTLFSVFTFHGGGAFILVIASTLILLNAIMFGKLNFEIAKKGFFAIFIAAILGNLWIFSWLKYGIPQDFGAAAPILDKIFSTKQSTKEIVSVGREIVEIIVFHRVQIIIFMFLILLYPLNLILRKHRKFILSSLSLSMIAVLLIYTGVNLGLPEIVSQKRASDYLFLVTAVGSGLYFNLIENPLKKLITRLSKKFYHWYMTGILSLFAFISILVLPTWNDTKVFLQYTNQIQYNSIAMELYNIKTLREPYSYTIVGFTQSYSKVLDKGFHIEASNFLIKYNPYAPEIEIPTKYIYIIVESIPNTYKGMDEYYYRWRKDIELQLSSWVKIYSEYHDNIKIFASKEIMTIYEIDNRDYVKHFEKKEQEKIKKKLLGRK